MPLYRLPTGKGGDSLDTDISRTIELDGISYDIRFRWNTRDEAWTVSCGRSGGDTIFSTKATTNRTLNSLYKYREDCPQGEMVIIDLAGDGGRLDYDNFTLNGRFRFLYNSII